MTGNATPPPVAAEDRDREPDWLEDLQADLRRAAERPDPPAPRGLLARLLDDGA